MPALARRSERSAEHTWDRASVFVTPELWEAAVRELDASIPELEAYRGRLGESAATLRKWLRRSEELLVTLGKVTTYASMANDEDVADPMGAERWQRALGVAARVGAATSFHEPELAALGRERIAAFQKAEPALAHFAQHFDTIFRRQAHLRSPEVEELLAHASDPLSTPYVAGSALTDGDLRFGAVEVDGESRDVAQGTIAGLLESPEREVRRRAWELFADGHHSVRTTLAALLAGQAKATVFRARARRYPSARSMAMDQSFVPEAVFTNVTETFRANLPVWHRYWRALRRALGVETLRAYDIHAPLTTAEPEIDYTTALKWLEAGLAPLGEEYLAPLRRGLNEERWVDVYPNQGKRGGAYSGGSHGTHPFVLMNWMGGLRELSTLAHEMGHSMHSYFSREAQSPIYSDYSIFAAEVASNFNQALLRAHLLATHPERDFQLAVLSEAMANFHRYLFVMPLLALFEDRIHAQVEAGEGLTAESMSAIMVELFQEGYGGELEIDPKRDGIVWAEFPHLYMEFYVYQYSTGISAAAALAEGILAREERAVERYLDFLKAGSSRYPVDALELAGVDMRTPAALESAFRTLEGLITRIEQLTG